MFKLNCGHVRCVVGVTVLLVFSARSRVVPFVFCKVSFRSCRFSLDFNVAWRLRSCFSDPCAFLMFWTVCGFCMEHVASLFRVFAVGRFLSCTAVFVVFCLWSWRPVFNVLPLFFTYVSVAIVCKLWPYIGLSGDGVSCSVGTAFLDRSFETLFRSYTFILVH